MKYPVNEEKCALCSACSLVTKDIAGNYIPENEYYYQCLAMCEDDCLKSFQTKDVNYYCTAYHKKWVKCYKESMELAQENPNMDVTQDADEGFAECANADEVVGYYMCIYGSEALKMWQQNIANKELSVQDKQIDLMLKELSKN